ncbi:elastase-1 [Esox lucius]|uniref:pancreatic elastase n=1 Tax=Esox lucius TaxID=8010 RepID=A0A3P8YHB4_ESOLU|nr:elastase-1 [Esox lucius]
MLKLILLSALTILVLTEDLVLQPRYLEDVPQTRVVGGEVAKPHSWPWQVSIQVLSDTRWTHDCGGTLIRAGWVMTAAHCVDSSQTRRVVLGAHNLLTENGTEQFMRIKDVSKHPQWRNDVYKGYDIALIELSTEAKLNSAVKLASLPPPNMVLPNKHPCYITGWGRTSFGGSPSSYLKEALLPIVDYNTCSEKWGAKVNPTMVCAGRGRNSGCHGDSGGPLNCQVGGRYYIHGVTSFGSKCSTVAQPSVFTRVSAYIGWINQIINRKGAWS